MTITELMSSVKLIIVSVFSATDTFTVTVNGSVVKVITEKDSVNVELTRLV